MKLEMNVSPVDAVRLAAGVGFEVEIPVRARVSRVVVAAIEGTEGTVRDASVEFEVVALDLPAEVLARLNG